MRPRLVRVDVDGTLADTWPWSCGVLDDAAGRFGFRPVDPAEAQALRDLGPRELLRALDVPWHRLPAIATYLRRRAAADAGSHRLFPGVPALLDELAGAGVTPGCSARRDPQRAQVLVEVGARPFPGAGLDGHVAQPVRRRDQHRVALAALVEAGVVAARPPGLQRRASRRRVDAQRGGQHRQAPLDRAAWRGHRRGGQLDLTFRPSGRGGARPGAGRPRLAAGHRRRPDHKRRAELSRHHPVHVTLRACAAVGRLRRRDAYAAIRAATEVVVGRPDFRIVQLSIQHNHVHLVAEADDKRALANGVRAFMISATRRLNAAVARRGAVFERYHVTVLRTPRQVRHALAYVLCNWRRHREHLGVAQARTPLDPYSSAPSFTGWRSRPASLGLPRGYRPLLVCGARTWLLTRGWREHYPALDPREVPGPGG